VSTAQPRRTLAGGATAVDGRHGHVPSLARRRRRPRERPPPGIGTFIGVFAGAAFTFLPSATPFIGVLALIGRRLSLSRVDLVWLTAAAALAAIGMVSSPPAAAAQLGLQVLGAWLIFRAFQRLAPIAAARSGAVGAGLLIGLLTAIVVGAWRGAYLDPLAPAVTQLVMWDVHPSVYAHVAVVVGALVAITVTSSRSRMAALVLAAVAAIAAGSLEAALAWLVVALGLLAIDLRRNRSAHALELGVVAGVIVSALVVIPALGFGAIGFTLDTETSTGTNLLVGTEIPTGDWWISTGVTSRATLEQVAGAEMHVYEVVKSAPEGWSRLQQRVPVQPGETYTASVWLDTVGGGRPSLQGWAGVTPDGGAIAAVGRLTADGWTASGSGGVALVDARTLEQSGTWRRVSLTFTLPSDLAHTHVHIGVAPDDRSGRVGEITTRFAGLQVERGEVASRYEPAGTWRALTLQDSRLAIWRQASDLIRARPWGGWGVGGYSHDRADLDLPPQLGTASVAHAHNLWLHTGVERGVLGMLAVTAVLVALSMTAWARRDAAFLVVVAAVVVLNSLDVTLFRSEIVYPLAAIAGLRAVTARPERAVLGESTRPALAAAGLAGIDVLVAWSGWVAASVVLQGWTTDALPGTTAAAVTLLVWPALVWREGLYPGFGLSEPEELRRHVAALVSGLILLAAARLLFGDGVPIDLVTLAVLTPWLLVLGPVGRGLVKRVLLHSGTWGAPIIVFGADATAERLVALLARDRLIGLRPVAVFDDSGDRPSHIAGVPVLGTVDDGIEYARTHELNRALVTARRVNADTVDALTRTASSVLRHVQFVPDLGDLPPFGVGMTALDKTPVVELRNELASTTNRALKRTFDLLGAVLGGVAIAPLLLALALAVALTSRGPVVYGHWRVGRHGRRIRIWKFRTMVGDADAVLERVLAEDPARRAEWESNHKLVDDPRVTPVGHWLRRRSLDELPQLWNVIRGEMSLVGPRPIVALEQDRYGPAAKLYTSVRPGMTGYWQVSGRSETEYEERVALDTFYVRNWSIWLDLVILARTIGVVVRGKGAY
jgi:Undecaprenyl-phosphate galactose phosphotransferase WbaP